MPLGMMMNGVIGTTAQEEVVDMVGGGIAQRTDHVLVQTMVAQQVLYMVRMAGAEVLFVTAIGDLLLTDQDPHLPTEEHMTNQELYYDAINASGNSCRAFSGLQPAGRTYCACTGVSP